MNDIKERIMVDMSATIIHHGHIRLLKKASEYGRVIVGLTSDEEILSKKGYSPELKFEYRKEVLESIKYVYEVVETPWLLTERTLEEYNIDLLVHGDDNSNHIKKEKLLIFPRTQGVCSSDIRQRASKIFKSKQNNIYDTWNIHKQNIEKIKKEILFEEKDIVFLRMGKNIGFEEDGKGNEFLRPVLIYKKFNNHQFVGLAMTSKKPNDKNKRFYYQLKEDSFIILSQIKTYSSKRIKYNTGKISKKQMKEIYDNFNKLLYPFK